MVKLAAQAPFMLELENTRHSPLLCRAMPGFLVTVVPYVHLGAMTCIGESAIRVGLPGLTPVTQAVLSRR